jgi:hypothetical protein
MSVTTISPLRQRMIEDMSLRNLAPRTQEAYIRGCRKLAAFLRRLPDTATAGAAADWVVYAKEPFGGPQQVLRYLARYTHRVAISNRRLIAADDNGVTFRYKDYRIDGPGRYTTMTLDTHEFIRRFLMHVLPKGLHRIRHYGFLANGNRAANIARLRELLSVASPTNKPETSKAAAADQACALPSPCSCCGGRMLIIEFFKPGCEPSHPPSPTPPVLRIDTS